MDPAPESRPPAAGWPAWLGAIGIVSAAAWVQSPALRAPFFADDWLFLDHGRRFPLAWRLTHADPLGNYFRPLSRGVWFSLLDVVGGGRPEVFHAAGMLLFALAGLLLFSIARRAAGARGAVITLGLFAFSYAFDVPLRWAAGAQDLLALVFGLVALAAWQRGRRWGAGIAFLAAFLCKESVLPLPLVAWRLEPGARPAGSPRWRRFAPLFAAWGAWVLLWLLSRSLRPAAGHELSFSPADTPLVFVRLLQSFLGAEWLAGTPWRFVPPPTGLLVGVLCAAAALVRLPAEPDRRGGAVRAGLLWALVASLPIAVVLPIWSAYFELVPIAGLCLAAGAALAGFGPWVGAAAVLVAGLASAQARALPGFAMARDPSTTASHVDRAYLERSQAFVAGALADLRSQRPTLPSRATVFFAQVPSASGFQMGDGALLRVAYRDTSLRAYYLGEFDRVRASRGPMLFFVLEGGHLRDHTADPQVLENFAYSMLLSDRPGPALDALELRSRPAPGSPSERWRPWLLWQAGRTREAEALLGVGVRARASAWGVPDSMRAIDRWLLADSTRARAVEHALALRAALPDVPLVWRHWAAVQLHEGMDAAARASLERYFRIGGEAAARDSAARAVLENLRDDASRVVADTH